MVTYREKKRQELSLQLLSVSLSLVYLLLILSSLFALFWSLGLRGRDVLMGEAFPVAFLFKMA